MAEFAKGLAASPATGAQYLLPAAANPRVTCRYCSSIFIVAAGKNQCPNCGAPAA
jgi:rubrerythrin